MGFKPWDAPDTRRLAIEDALYLKWVGRDYFAYQILVALAASVDKQGDDFYDEELEKVYVHPVNRSK